MLRSHKILFLSNAHNCMSQRLALELRALNHKVNVQLAVNEKEMKTAVKKVKPDLIICPFLTIKIPEEIYKAPRPCIIVHPGIKGDRGISSLDWALLRENKEWGVTLLQAAEKMDAGDIWSTKNFKVPLGATKSSLYQEQVISSAVEALKETLYKFENGILPEPLDYSKPDVKGTFNPRMKDSEREVSWDEPVEKILAKIRSADGNPGAYGNILGHKLRLFNVSVDDELGLRSDIAKFSPGEIIGQRFGALCIKTKDAPIWISHLKRDDFIKLPAMSYFMEQEIRMLPEENGLFIDGEPRTYQDIFCNIKDEVATLNFRFLNGAMNKDQCRRLKEALETVAQRKDIKVVILKGSKNYFSNGINLNSIEAAQDKIKESNENINAMNDCTKALFSMTDKVTVAYIEGNAGAGGVMMPLAADFVFVNPGSVLNPHYKSMGLYGSEYWTYFLKKRVGKETALKLTEDQHPVLGREMVAAGLVDKVIQSEEDFEDAIREIKGRYSEITAKKREERTQDWFDEVERKREKELRIMKGNFRHKEYQKAVHNFVYKTPPKQMCSLKYFQDTPFKKKIDCKTFVEEKIENEIKPKMEMFFQKFGKTPGIGIIQVGTDPASTLYVERKMKTFREHGFYVLYEDIPREANQDIEEVREKLVNQIKAFNASPFIHGIILQLPLPKGLDLLKLFDEIQPEKDIEGFHSSNLAKILLSGVSTDKDLILPCTVRGVTELLDYYSIKVQGKTVVTVGKGLTFGLPLSMYLITQGATVVSCDLHTVDLEEKLALADIVITSCGSKVSAETIKPGTIILDVGTRIVPSEDSEKEIVGDIDKKQLKYGYYTPVPGGLGRITVASAMLNTIDAFERIEEKIRLESQKKE